MPTARTLNVVNYFDTSVHVAVTDNGFNCCDRPQPGETVGEIAPNDGASLVFCKKSGHGCNGRQGEFQLSFNSNDRLDLNFDSDGILQFSAQPSTFGAFLQTDSDGNYTLVVGHRVGNAQQQEVNMVLAEPVAT